MRNSTSNFLIITLSLVPMVLADVTIAQSENAQKPPDFLVLKIEKTREKTLFNVMELFHWFAGEDGVLTKEDIVLFDQRKTALKRANFLQGIIRLDLDGDGVVTRAEIEKAEKSRIRYVKMNYSNGAYSKLKNNQDGSIDIQKAYNSVVKSPKIYSHGINSSTKHAQQFLALNTSGGVKQISSKVVWKMVAETFDYYDDDGDGVLRDAELRKANKEKKQISLDSNR